MSSQSTPRKPANLSIDADILNEAKSLKINLSQAAEAGLRHAITKVREEAWKRENKGALNASNEWVEENGLPLSTYRQF